MSEDENWFNNIFQEKETAVCWPEANCTSISVLLVSTVLTAPHGSQEFFVSLGKTFTKHLQVTVKKIKNKVNITNYSVISLKTKETLQNSCLYFFNFEDALQLESVFL